MNHFSSAPLRRRLGAASAVLGLVAASVVGGVALSASAATTPEVTTPLSTVASSFEAATNPLYGTADPDFAVTIFNEDTHTEACYVLADDAGNWSCPDSISLAVGENNFNATSMNPDLSADFATVLFTVTRGTSTAPTIAIAGDDGSHVFSSPIVQFTGAGPAYGSINVAVTAAQYWITAPPTPTLQ